MWASGRMPFANWISRSKNPSVGIRQEGPAALRGLASALKALSKARKRMEGGGGGAGRRQPGGFTLWSAAPRQFRVLGLGFKSSELGSGLMRLLYKSPNTW